MSLWQRYLGGMVSGAGSVLIKTGLNIIVIPVFISRLGLDAFGLYLLLIAIMEVATLLDLGTTNALVTLLGAEAPESPSRRAYLKVGHGLFALLALACAGIGGLVFPHFAALFHIGPALQAAANLGFLLISLEAALMLYSCYARSVLLAHCAHQWTNLADTLYNVIANVGALVLLLSGFGLTAVILARLIGAVLRLLLMLSQAHLLEPYAFRPRVPFQAAIFKKVATLGSHAMMLNFSIIISHKIDDIVIACFLPLSAVSIYEIVFRFLGITVQICLKLSEGAFPLFSRMAASRQISEARQLFLRMSGLLHWVASLLILMILCHYTELFHLFSANRIPIAQTWPVLVVAVPCILSGVLQMPANAWLFTWGHQKFLTTTSLIAALSNLALSVLLVQAFGLIGVALGTLIPQLIQHQAGLIRKTCRELQIPAAQYLRDVHGAILFPLLVSFVWIQLLKFVFNGWTHSAAHPLVSPVLSITLISASAGLIGSALWFRFTASSLEKRILKDILQTQLWRPLQARLKQKPTAG
jgi:O-antigen/teichoic acid export membrane protein